MPAYYATCPSGAEQLLATELRTLGIADPKPTRGGVAFDSDDIEQAYKVCLHSSMHQRLLLILKRFSASTPDELYAGAQQLDWSEHLDVDGTFRIDAKLRDTDLGKPHFAALRLKDAIVDQFRAKFDRRPSVQIRQPDLRIDLFVHKQSAQLAMDLGGSWTAETPRGAVGDAMDAAVLLRFADMAQQTMAVVSAAHADVIAQAAMHTGGLAPGLLKHDFGFAGWLGHVPAKWNRLLNAARAQAQEQDQDQDQDQDQESGCRVHVFEPDAKTLQRARKHCRALGVDHWVHWHEDGPWNMRPPSEHGVLLVCLSAFSGDQNGPVETAVKRRFGGWRVIRRVEEGEGASRQWSLKQARPLRITRGKRVVALQDHPAREAPSRTPSPPPVSPWPDRSNQTAVEFEDTGGSGAEVHQTAAERNDGPPDEIAAGAEAHAVANTPPPEAPELINRLRKNHKHLRRWARKQQVSCYRLYDADLPHYSAAVDIYQGTQTWAVIQEYAAPDEVPEQLAQQRLDQIVASVAQVLELSDEAIAVKQRQRQRGKQQYEKTGQRGGFHAVQEAGLKLMVNFTDYLDTGLFLDHRDVRAELGQRAKGKHVLNLFAYTGVATLHMVAGGASSSTTVDMSRTYLDWAQRNLLVNKLQAPQHRFLQADCLAWLEQQAQDKAAKRYGLIFMDPPTFSSSKRMDSTLDVQRDHVQLIRKAVSLLRPGGELVFSNNYRKFKLDRSALDDLKIEDITASTLPEDFRRRPRIHSVFIIRRAS